VARGLSGQRDEWRIVEFPARKKPISRFVRQDLTNEQQKAVGAYLGKCQGHTKGPFWNSYKFKKLTDSEGVWEMKPSAQVRLLGFFPPDKKKTFVLTNGFIKKQNRTPPQEIKKAERIRQQYLRAIEGGE